jgi:hypothetical protein
LLYYQPVFHGLDFKQYLPGRHHGEHVHHVSRAYHSKKPAYHVSQHVVRYPSRREAQQALKEHQAALIHQLKAEGQFVRTLGPGRRSMIVVKAYIPGRSHTTVFLAARRDSVYEVSVMRWHDEKGGVDMLAHQVALTGAERVVRSSRQNSPASEGRP